MPWVVPGSLQGCKPNGFGQTYFLSYFLTSFLTEWFIVLHFGAKNMGKIIIPKKAPSSHRGVNKAAKKRFDPP